MIQVILDKSLEIVLLHGNEVFISDLSESAKLFGDTKILFQRKYYDFMDE